ncbi:hypothetical protein TNCV_5134161 [Trichonephila clavipes]|nr:hypothetical protein TNCV_5134161 [Trichonephila clavipes]
MGGKYSPVPCTRDSVHKTLGPTDLTSTYSVCTRRVFGTSGIEPRRFGLESDALTIRLPTALAIVILLYGAILKKVVPDPG